MHGDDHRCGPALHAVCLVPSESQRTDARAATTEPLAAVRKSGPAADRFAWTADASVRAGGAMQLARLGVAGPTRTNRHARRPWASLGRGDRVPLDSLSEIVHLHVQVDGSRIETGVAEKALDRHQVRAVLQQ